MCLLKMVDNSFGFSLSVPHVNKHVKLPEGDFTMPGFDGYDCFIMKNAREISVAPF